MVTDTVEAETVPEESATETQSTTPSGESEDGESLTVTAHLRASPTGAAARRQQSVLQTLRTLESEGVVPDLAVERWGSRVNVPTDANADDTGAVALYEEFETVAEREDLQLEPFFEVRQAVGGLLSSGPPTERIIVFPVVSITVRREGDLTGLYPCWSDGDHQSVEDALEALESETDVENL